MSDRNGALPNGWVQATIKELCDLNPKHDHELSDETPVSFVPMAAVSDVLGTITERQVRTLREVRKGYTHFADGDVIFAKITPCMENGKAASVCGMTNGLACGTTEFYVLRPRGAIDQDFLFQFIRQESYRKAARATMQSGVGQARVPKEFVLNTELPVPPLAEQRRIVAQIEALQERSRRVREVLAEVGPLLEQFRQSVLAAVFRGDLTADWRAAHPDIEPTSELLHRIRAERRRRWEQAELAKYEAKGQKPPRDWKDKYKGPEPVDDTGLPELPEGWVWSNFDEVSLIDGGLTKHEAKRSNATAFVPLISVAAVQHGYIDSTQVGKIGLLPTDGDKGKLEKNDLLIVEGNGSLEHIGRAALWDGSIDNARHQNHLIRVRPALLDPRFALYWLGSPRGRTNLISQATSAAGLYNLSLGKVGRVYIPIPPLDEQTEIIKQLNAARTVLQSVFSLQRMIVSDLYQLDQSILTKAFRGALVPQDPNDEPASALLARIREQKAQQTEGAKHKQKTLTQQRGNKRSEDSSRLTPQQLTLTEVLCIKD